MPVNIELYRVFYCVAKLKSFSSAARELFISQPAVSLNIRQLEKQLGGKLFYRTRMGAELTENGEAILEYVERATSLLDEAEKKFEQLRNLDTGYLRIGASNNICKNYLGSYIKDFSTTYPNLRIELHSNMTAGTIRLLKSGKIDLGFVNYPVLDDEIDSTPCLYLHDCFVVGDKFIEMSRNRQTIEELFKIPLLLLERGTNTRMIFEENMRRLGVRPKPTIEVGSHDLLVMFAKMNMGVACVTEEYVQKELANRELYKIGVNINFRPRRLGYCMLKNSHMNHVVKRFVSNIRDLELNNI